MSQLTVNTIQLGQSGTPANNFVLTVPSPQDGTIKLSRGNVGSTTQDVISVAANGKVSFPAGGGGIVQAVYGSTTTYYINNSGTLSGTGLFASITPTSTSNKILVLVSQNINIYRAQSSQAASISILRDSTNLYTATTVDQYLSVGNSTSTQISSMWSYSLLDTPPATVAYSYNVKAAVTYPSNGGYVAAQASGEKSSIVLLELAV